MIRSRRSLVLVAGLTGLSLLSCGREVTGPGDGMSYGRNRIAAFALEPQFPTIPGANAISDVVPFTRVRMTLRRTDGTIAKDTLVNFPAGVDSITLAIDVPLPITAPDSGVTLGLSLAYVNAAGDTVFRGGPLPVTARPSGGSGSSQTVSIPVVWVPPPGVPLPASVDLTPATGSAVAGTTTTFSAVARDGQGQPLAGIPAVFSSLDTTRAVVNAPGSGLVTWRAVRGPARVVATLPNLVADTSTINVSLPATRLFLLSGLGQSATINTALASPIVLRVGAIDTVPVAGIPVTFVVTTGGGTLLASADTSDVNGLVQFSWTLGSLVGAQSVTATLSTNNFAFVANATGTAPVPTQVAFTASPATAVAGSTLSAVTVDVRDAGGGRTPLFNGPVSIALDAGATGATLAGTTTVNAVAGIATFNALSIQKAAAGLTFIATSAGLTADTSNALTITPAAAADLALVSGNTQSGAVSTALAAPFVARVTDAFNNPVAGASVTWAITAGGGALSATNTTTDAAGNASTTLTLPSVAGAVTVTATATGLTGSPLAFASTALPGTASQLVFTLNTGGGTAGVAITPGWTIEARDAGGNLATTFTGPVTVALANGPVGAVLGGSATVNAVAGVAAFANLSVDLVSSSWVLNASSPGLAGAQSAAFSIGAATAATLANVSGGGQSGPIFTALASPFIVRVTDVFTNPVAGVTVTWAIGAGGGSLSAPTSVTDVNGQASIAYTTGTATGTSIVNATVGGLAGSPVSFATTVGAGAATALVFTQQPTGTFVAGSLAADIIAQARDAGGNLATGFTGTTVLKIDTGPGAGTDSLVTAAVGGVATFVIGTFDAAGTYTVRVTAPGLTDAVSGSFTITPGPAAFVSPDSVSGAGQTGTVGQTLALPLRAQVTDDFDNGVAGIPVTFTGVRGVDTLFITPVTTDANGVASITPVLPTTPGPVSYIVTSTGLTGSGFPLNITVTAGPVAQLALTTPPTTGVVSTALPTSVVELRDAFGNLVTASSAFVGAQIDSGPAGATLAGNTPIQAVGGVATFTNIGVSLVGSYRLRYTSVGATDVLSPVFAVTAGGPASLVAFEGNGQSAPASSALTDSIGARVTDAGGNPVPGVTVTWSITSGGGSITPATSVTGANGVARARWTLGGSTGTQGARADIAGFNTGFTATATVTDANILWTGAVSAAWSTPGNWSGGVVPTATDSVRIPSGTPFAAALDASGAIVSRLAVANGATLVLDTLALFVSGSLDVAPGASVLSDSLGGFALIGTSGTVLGAMPRLFVQAGAYTLGGPVAVGGDLFIGGGSLAVGSNALTVGGNFLTNGAGTFSMTGPGTLTIQGDAILAGGSTAGQLTSGVLTVRGDFTQAGGSPQAFSASAGHTVVLDGPSTQAVALLTPDLNLNTSCTASCFGTLRSLRGAGSGALQVNSNLKALGFIDVSGDSLDAAGQGLISTGTPSLASSVVVARFVAWQDGLVRTAGTFAVDSLVAWGSGNLIVGETVPTVVAGAYNIVGPHPAPVIIESGGSLAVAGTVAIGGGTGTALTTRGTGRVLMQQASDTLTVAGDADFGGATTGGLMNAGVLQLAGDFTMSNNSVDAFIAEGAHLTRLVAANPSVSFIRIGGNRFANLDIDATGAMTFVGNANIVGTVKIGPATSVVGGGLITIGGDLIDSLGFRWQATETFFDANDPTIPRQFTGSVVFNNSVTIDTTMSIGGNLEIRSGLLDLNGWHVTVNGDFETRDAGVLRMVSAADTLSVTGTARFRGNSSVGQMTAGLLQLFGDFTQLTTAEAFAPSGSHQTWFRGSVNQTISFANAGSGLGSSHFAAVGVGQTTPGISVQLLSGAVAEGMLLTEPAASLRLSSIANLAFTSLGATVDGLQFDNVRWILDDGAPATPIDNVSFVGTDPGATALTIARSTGVLQLNNPTFAVTPTTGRYVQVSDPDATANGAFSLAVSNPTPSTHSGLITEIAPATITGWGVGAFAWTGNTSADWFDPANWVQNAVPGSVDSVIIPAAGVTNMPTFSSAVLIRALVNQNAAPIAVGGVAVLGVTQRLVFRDDVPGATCTTGFVDVGQGSATAVMRGRVDCPLRSVALTSVTLDGAVTVGGGFGLSVQSAGDLIVNGQIVTVDGELSTFVNSRLVMTNAADSVTVGSAYFGGGNTTGLLNAGSLTVRGGFTAENSPSTFAASGAHRTRFISGVGDTASVSASNGPVTFGQLEVARPARIIGEAAAAGDVLVNFGGSLTGAGRLAVNGTFTGTTGTFVALRAVELAGVLADTGAFRPDTTIFSGASQVMPFRVGAAAIPNYQVVRILGDVTAGITGGLDSVGTDLLIDGGTFRVDDAAMAFIRVGRDFRVTNGGRFFSQNQNHQYLIYRNVLFDGADGAGALDSGSFRLRGDFTQLASSSPTSFVPAPAFAVAMDSVGTISFATPAQSRFGRLSLPVAGATRTLLTAVEVASTLELNGSGQVIQSDVFGAGGTRQLTVNGLLPADAALFRNVALRLQGADAVDLSNALTFSDFDVNTIQFEIARDSGTIEFFAPPSFGTTPVVNGRYLRVVDTNPGDGANLTVNITGTPTPAFHNGFAEAQAPALLTGWGQSPDFTWTGGATNGDWNNPANWSGGTIPAATDSVFVPGALLYSPSIPGGTTLRAFVSARTEGPITTAGAFTITERLAVPTTGGLTCGGTLSFTTPTPKQARGRVTCFTRILDGTLTVTDTLGIFANDLQVEGTSTLDVFNAVISVDGQFSTLGSAILRMQNDSSHVSLNSGASFGGGSTAGFLTAGLLEIGGNFTQNGDAESFSASGTHLTDFRPNGQQQLSFANPGFGAGTSHLANFMISSATSGDTLRLNTDLYAAGQLRSGVGNTGLIYTATGAALITGGASLTSATLDAVRWEIRDGAAVDQLSGIAFQNMDPTVAQLSMIRSDGSAGPVTADNINFTTVPTTGVYILVNDPDGAANSTFWLSLSSMDPPGHGGFITQLNTAFITGWDAVAPFLWLGTVDTDWNNTANWAAGVVPSATDSVTISAAAIQGPDINAPTTIRALVNESATVAVTLQSQPLTITRTLRTLYGVAGVACSDSPLLTIAPSSGTATVQGRVGCDLAIGGDAVTVLSDSLIAGRSLRVSDAGEFDVNGRTVRVTDSLVVEQNGLLRIANATSLVDVTRDASFRGSISTGTLTQGRLRVGGDFTQSLTAEAFDALPALTLELYDAFAGAEGTPTLSLANPAASLLGSVAFTSGARDIVTPVTVRGDLVFGTTGNVTGTGTVNVLGSVSDTTTYGGSPATLSLPYLAVEGEFAYAGTIDADTIYLGSPALERPLPASILGTRVPYRTLIVGGQRVVTVASPTDSLVTTGNLIVNSIGVLRFAAAGATAVTRIGDTLRVAPSGSIVMTEPGATAIAQNGVNLGGTSTVNNGTLRIGGDVLIQPGAFTAVNAHITELFDGSATLDSFNIAVLDTTAYFSQLRPESGTWTFAGTQADTVLIQTALNLTGTATLNGDAVVRVFGPVQGQPTSTIALRHLAYFNDWQFTGTYQVDTLTLFGSGGQPLYARDASTAPIPYNVVRITGDVRPIVAPADELTILSTLLIDGGTFRVGTAANGTDSVRVQINGRLTTLNGGVLEMTHAEGRMNVNGDATFGGGSTDGRLTTGALVLQGDFIQGGGAGDAFRPTGAHLTQFSTEGGQAITFATPGANAGESSFRTLRIRQAGGSQIQLLSDAFVTGQFEEQMNDQARIVGDIARMLTVGGTNLDSVRFDRVALNIVDGGTVEGMTTLTFDSLPGNTTQLIIQRAGGAIALDDITFAVVPAAGNNYIDATDTNIGDADPLTINITGVSPSGHGGFITTAGGAVINGWGAFGDIVWAGTVNGDWNTAANWVGGVVPDASSNVTIGASANDPVLAGPRTVRNLTVNLAATLTLPPGDTLTVTGNTLVTGTIAASAPNDSTTVLRLAPPGVASLAAPGTIGPKLLITSGFVGVTDSVRVTGDSTMGVEISGGTLDLNQRRMNITGSFRTTGTGVLQMLTPQDSLIVDENIFFDGGSTEGTLTDGTIVAAHDFIQQNSTSTNAFAATGSHLVRFVGSTYTSLVNLVSSGPTVTRFANVALDKSLPRAVRFFNTPIQIGNLVSIAGPVLVENANVVVSGTVIQPGTNGTWDVDATSTVSLSGVNAATCDGFSFVVTTTPANFTPTSCWNPPAIELAWTGGGGNSLWSNPANWSLGRVPVATDSVTINQTATIDLNGAATVGWLIMGLSSSPTLNLNNGATLQVDSAALTTTGTTVNMVSGSTLTGDGGVSIGGQLNWNGGTMSGAGVTVIQSGGTADIASTAPVTLNERSLSVAGTATIGEFDFNEANSPVLATLAGGELTFTAPKSLFLGSAPSIVNAGTLRISPAGTTVRIDWPIVNTGTLEVASGTLDLRNTLTHASGTISILPNATLVNGGNTNANAAVVIADFGTLTLQSGGISADAGNHIFSPTSSVSGLGAMRINSADTVRIQGAMDLDSLTVQNGTTWFESAADTMFVTNGAYLGGGFVRGTGVVGIRGNFSTSGGNLNGTGTFAVLPGGFFSLGGALRGWIVDVGSTGTARWGDLDWSFEQEPISLVYASMRIRSGGVLDIQHGATDREMFGTGAVTPPNNVITVDAGGTIRKSTGSAISNIRPRVLLSGLFDVQTGTINVQGSCAVTGGTLTGAGQLTGNFSPTGGCVIP